MGKDKKPQTPGKFIGKLLDRGIEEVKKRPTLSAAAAGFVVGGPVGAVIGAAATTEPGKKVVGTVVDKANEIAGPTIRDAARGLGEAAKGASEIKDNAQDMVAKKAGEALADLLSSKGRGKKNDDKGPKP